ncbi:hypothetical protein [Lentzea cavernae]|uniref:HNH endonuclease n=1 Tax=Lentzea cavernae TaxID=2020703 RepID=A0ABQ3MR42_9PSEU|nr:hypothetical protein [Lentzea cavernae]GHH57714.1 hypothetical protein GCM10017774_77750 [Lentzea cavernae]
MVVISRPCTKCGVDKPLEAFRKNAAYRDGYTRQCIECIGARRRERYHAAPEREKQVADKWTAANRDRVNAKARERRVEALRVYSTTPDPSCACCGEGTLAFLTFEHIGGGGNQHRRQTGGGGFISWLRKHNYPPGFEVLCMNCNHGRRVNAGVCPHDELVRQLLPA